MRPTDVRLVPVRLPFRRPFVTARGTIQARTLVLVALRFEHTPWGFGESAPPPSVPMRPSEAFRKVARRVKALRNGAWPTALDRRRVEPWVRCGLLQATMDSKARAAGRDLATELAKMLGRNARAAATVPVNAVVGRDTPTRVVASVRAAVARGFRTIKLKSQAEEEDDHSCLQGIRAAVGNGVGLRLDVNGTWTARAASRRLPRLARYDLEYVEQPMATSTFLRNAPMVRESGVAIALDESVTDLPTARRLLRGGIAHAFVLKPQRLGGLDRLLEIAHQAAENGVTSTVSSSFESAVGRTGALAAASLLPRPIPACGLATGEWLLRDVSQSAPRVRSGSLRRTLAPGLGFVPKPFQSRPISEGG